MTVNINCEACGKVYSVKIEAAGQTFVCQACGGVCVVPSGNQPMDPGPVYPGPVGTQPSSALAIVSLVLSIMSLILSCLSPCCGGPLALAGAITGFIGLKKVQAGTASGKGLAMGGMITSIVVIVLTILYLLIFVLLLGGAVIIDVNNF
jgi:hypothetical protein